MGEPGEPLELVSCSVLTGRHAAPCTLSPVGGGWREGEAGPGGTQGSISHPQQQQIPGSLPPHPARARLLASVWVPLEAVREEDSRAPRKQERGAWEVGQEGREAMQGVSLGLLTPWTPGSLHLTGALPMGLRLQPSALLLLPHRERLGVNPAAPPAAPVRTLLPLWKKPCQRLEGTSEDPSTEDE